VSSCRLFVKRSADFFSKHFFSRRGVRPEGVSVSARRKDSGGVRRAQALRNSFFKKVFADSSLHLHASLIPRVLRTFIATTSARGRSAPALRFAARHASQVSNTRQPIPIIGRFIGKMPCSDQAWSTAQAFRMLSGNRQFDCKFRSSWWMDS